MGSAQLRWTSDRGFEVDVEVSDDEVALRLLAVPVPADGTLELEQGVDLDRLDILFKAFVEIQGESAQLQDARLKLLRDPDGMFLEIDARCEDMETGETVPWIARVEVQLPPGVPEKGGPKPMPTNEDDLDWEDETTLERLVVSGPETPVDPERTARPRSKEEGAQTGLQALLKALSSLDDEDEPSEITEEPSEELPRPIPEPVEEPSEELEGDDQSMGAVGEARSLLKLLIDGDHLELEDDGDLDALAEGVVEILALPWSAERKAHRLSEWLLAQDGVADLYIGDDDLAEILDRW
ncbi:MAG: hypothetical protein H6735_18180 [Alphaproteobacteria bacterium]|nr:hypothetical protein [Alphaproteobacteria bacterium]